jgi:crotonobetainyl-CoA:carnitine CoA-transferase CaiB-like acyl-CoA transferase
MDKPLEGIRVIEVAMWAYVPSAGGVLADWGAEVVKIEAPTGDPIRGLVSSGIGKTQGITYPWENFNRGKRGMALDLKEPVAQKIVHQLAESADVFLTSLLPRARKKLAIDHDDIRSVNPQIVYAVGSGQGARGDEADKGGYDSITFWSRGSVSASVTPPGSPPLGMPAGAFGDSLSGVALAGGIAAALARKAKTGEGSLVDGSLLGTAMWSMQMAIVGAAVAGLEELPKMNRTVMANPLVNNYETKDGRWVALCMLQPDVYWAPLCSAIGRVDLIDDERFATMDVRAQHAEECIAELDKTFVARTLDEWKPVLASQPGQWDVVNRVSDVAVDPQALANGFVQTVDYGGDRELPLIANPVQFDRTPPHLRPAPEFGADTDDILQSLGWDWDAIIEAKASGAVI